MPSGFEPPDPPTSAAEITKELDRLERDPYVARLIRSLANHPPIIVVPEPLMRLAAILLALRARADGEPELLMIKRAEAEGDPWSGHIACPGGRMEPGDNDLAVTAVRETMEETGVDVARDGRFLMLKSTTEAAGTPAPDHIMIVLNWTEELKRLVAR